MSTVDAIRKKRQEEIELKRKRLEELKKAKENSAILAAETNKSVAAEESKLFSSNEEPPLISIQNYSSHKAEVIGQQKGGPKLSKISNFSFSRVSISIPPTEIVTYHKECQTEAEDLSFLVSSYEPDNQVHKNLNIQKNQDHQTEQTTFQTPGRKPRPMSVKSLVSAGEPIGSILPPSPGKYNENVAKKYSESEVQQIMKDETFLNFFEKAALHTERALAFNQSFNVLRDFSLASSGQETGTEKVLVKTQTLYECEYLKGRPIMDVRFSSLRPDLFLVAYGSRQISSTGSTKFNNTSNTTQSLPTSSENEDSVGLVCIWAKDLSNRPEIRLQASSPVLTALFHHLEPRLVFGGCYNGQILMWDISQSRSTPTQRSSWVSGLGHKHPVYAMALTLSHQLVSVSIDGTLCLWDTSRLTDPTFSVLMEIPVMKSNPLGRDITVPISSIFSPQPGEMTTLQPPLNVSCISYGQSDNSNLSHIIVGSGAGELFKCQLPYKPTENDNVKTNAHFGLITSIQEHPMSSNSKYKHLVLTSSLDWTVKLWNVNNLSQPLYEFFSPTCDYVCDVQWSPTHPAVFLTVSSTGYLCLWNLIKSVTEPVDSLLMQEVAEEEVISTSSLNPSVMKSNGSTHLNKSVLLSSSAAAATMTNALTKAAFSRDGQFVIVGDSQGTLHRLRIHNDHVTATANDENRLSILLLITSSSSMFATTTTTQSPSHVMNPRSKMTPGVAGDEMLVASLPTPGVALFSPTENRKEDMDKLSIEHDLVVDLSKVEL
jgi:WD40 repeat protein